MDPVLSAAYAQPSWTRKLLVRMDLPGASYGLTDGGFIVYEGLTYLGADPSLGLFVGVSGLSSGVGDKTTRVEVRMAPKNTTAASILGSANTQGSRVRVWRGAVDRATGLLIGTPVLRFDGEIDQPRFTVGQDRTLTIACGTQSARQLEENADWRANHSFHTTRWPGEAGMVRVAGITKITQDLGTWRT
jgi:hypothetical protein